MKLTNIKGKISHSIFNSIHNECYIKLNDLISYDVWMKIHNEIWMLNWDSIQDMQKRILNKLQNEIK